MEFLRILEGIRTPFFDTIIGLITRFGEETVAIVVLCAIFWCISKRTAYGICVAYFLSGLTVQGLKIIFRIDRPWIIDPAFNAVESAKAHATGYSFPSGHTQSATALFGSLGVQVKKIPFQIICFTLLILVGFSRMYLGVHTPQDVIASILITMMIVVLAVRFFTGEKVSKKRQLVLSSILFLYVAIVIVIAVGLYSTGKIEEKYLSDCLKAAGAGLGFAVGMFIERIYIDFSVNAKNYFWQALKFILGIAGVLIIKEGLKLIIGTGLIVDTLRYFIMILWVIVFYPLIIKRFFTAKPQLKTAEGKAQA